MLTVIYIVGGIWSLWFGIRYLQSEEFSRTYLGGYKKSEDGRYPGNWRIWIGLLGIMIGTLSLLAALDNLGVL